MRSIAISVVFLTVAAVADRADGLPYYVRAQASTSVSGLGLLGAWDSDSISIGPIQALSATADPRDVSGSTVWAHADAAGIAAVSPGVMRAYAGISALGVNAGAGASGSLEWGDTITIQSDTLPLGTPVQLQAALSLHRSLSGSPGTVVYASAYGPFGLSIYDSLSAPNPVQSVSKLVSTQVGSVLSLSGWMYFNAGGTSEGPGISALMDAWNTSRFTLEVLTPGAGYSSASGLGYAVPEPGTATLLGIGVAVAGLILRFGRGRRA